MSDQPMLSKFGAGDTTRLELATDTYDGRKEVEDYIDSLDIDIVDAVTILEDSIRFSDEDYKQLHKLERRSDDRWGGIGKTHPHSGANPPAQHKHDDLQDAIDEAADRIRDEYGEAADEDQSIDDRDDEAQIIEQCRAVKPDSGERCTNAVSHMGSEEVCGPHQRADNVTLIDDVDGFNGGEDDG